MYCQNPEIRFSRPTAEEQIRQAYIKQHLADLKEAWKQSDEPFNRHIIGGVNTPQTPNSVPVV